MERHRRAAGALSQDPSHKWTLDTSPQVKARNRYGDVQAWENCRVHLKVPAGECDFINASPIVLKDPETDGEYKYIASQVRIPRDTAYCSLSCTIHGLTLRHRAQNEIGLLISGT